MTNIARRAFFKRVAIGSASASLAAFEPGPAIAFADCPDPNDPSDPNAIADLEHEIGKPYVGWREGDFDMHFIHTGGSENCFHIFPDGTTLLLDTGDHRWTHASNSVECLPKPNETRLPSEWVARYISRLFPELKTIDYVVASHFHTDHIGSPACSKGTTRDREPNYSLSGLAHVGEYFRFATAFDRGYPDYSRPTSFKSSEWENLVKFFEYKEKTDGLKREKFEVGALDQLTLRKSPGKYDFHVRNLVGNGVVWSGKEGTNIDLFETYPENKKTCKNENTFSLGCVFQYGPFRFYTAGDVSGPVFDENGKDVGIEGYVGRACGPVDVVKTNHHGSGGTTSKAFCQAVRARVYVTCCWLQGHVNPNICANMCATGSQGYSGARLLCPTDVRAGSEESLQGQPWRKQLCERGGHVVVKAYEGGKKYKVYFLTAEDESMKVNLVFGPFDSKGARA